MHLTKYQRPGFTLIEVVLYIAIMVTILFTIITFLIAAINSRLHQVAQSQVNSGALTAMQIMIHTIEQSSSITTPAPGNTGAQIVLSTPSDDTNPITFWQNGTTLMMQQGGHDAVSLTSPRVEVISFTVNNPTSDETHGATHIELQVRFPNTGNQSILNYEQTFYGSAMIR